MDRLIGIDYGRRRTGLAVSDPLRIFASALDTVDTAKLIDYLKKYAETETIERFVMGYPVNLDGAPSEARADVDAFLKILKKAFPDIPVTLEDERFTSVLAHRVMIDGGMKAKDRRDKKSVDWIRHRLVTGTALSILGTMLFILARQPYAGFFCLCILLVKGFLLLKSK